MSMETLDEFQAAAARTGSAWDLMPFNEHRMLLSMGLGGEAGEVLEIIKKEVGHGKPHDAAHIVEELGDLLWYIAELARVHGASLSEVATANQEKLRRRYPTGFSTEASNARRV